MNTPQKIDKIVDDIRQILDNDSNAAPFVASAISRIAEMLTDDHRTGRHVSSFAESVVESSIKHEIL